MERWRGRVALVTGASMGMGEAICRMLVSHGMKVVACARSEDKLKVPRLSDYFIPCLIPFMHIVLMLIGLWWQTVCTQTWRLRVCSVYMYHLIERKSPSFKGTIFLKNRRFIVQERFNKLIYGINTIIRCGTRQPVKFNLVSRTWNEMIFLSYLGINVANINSNIW